jgi:predicted 3-demethylubiquinone-9 3-methyltransferase (glyoxalase superfamily)
MTAITPCLWFDGNAEEAACFYTGLIPDSRIDAINRSPVDWPAGKAGDVLIVQFTLAGRPFTALNGGPEFAFTEALSLQLTVDDQAEIDRLWAALSSVPEAAMCGWCKDRYGLSWQFVPAELGGWMADPAVGARVMQALMAPMKKIDLATLRAAARGDA